MNTAIFLKKAQKILKSRFGFLEFMTNNNGLTIMRYILLLLSMSISFPYSVQAEVWGNLGETTVLNKEGVRDAFISGACQHLKTSVRKPGDIWYLGDDVGPVSFMAQDLDDAIYIRACNMLWNDQEVRLESVKYVGPFETNDSATAVDILTKYGKAFSTQAIVGYINYLESFDCGAPYSLPEKENDALRSSECGKSLDKHDNLISSFLSDCDNEKLTGDACDLIRSIQEKTTVLRRQRDVLLGLGSNENS
jgi:hypothetical protein